MSLKGGYQIIDLKFKPFDSREGTSHTFPELFNDLKNSNAKMIIISGLNMDGVKYNDYDVIFYEVEENNEPMYYQAVLRRIWTPIEYTCTTKYISIYNDDKVKITQDTFIYEILPDDEMSEKSTNALQNKVITQAFTDDRNRLTALEKLQSTYLKLDGSRTMTGILNMGNNKITGVDFPTEFFDVTNKRYVDKTITEQVEKGKSVFVYTSNYPKSEKYDIDIIIPENFSTMSIKISLLEQGITLDNPVSFNYVGLEDKLIKHFRSNNPTIKFSKINGEFKFPGYNISGKIKSNGDIITIDFSGDLTYISSTSPLFCVVPLAPVAVPK